MNFVVLGLGDEVTAEGLLFFDEKHCIRLVMQIIDAEDSSFSE